MYPAPFDYVRCEGIEQALELLAQHGGEAKVLAGGQSLIPMMKLRLVRPALVLDINRIPGLNDLRADDGDLHVGALVRHRDIVESSLVRDRLFMMVEAARTVADVQVRNLGTPCGSIVHAEPAGDWGPVALALNARLRVRSRRGEREIAGSDIFVDAYESSLTEEELATEVIFPIPQAPAGGAYLKMVRRAGDFPGASVAAMVVLDEGGACRDVGIGLGGAAMTSLKATAAEAALRGQRPTEPAIRAAAEEAARATDPLEDIRGSAQYKRELVAVLCRRALEAAVKRARGEEARAGIA